MIVAAGLLVLSVRTAEDLEAEEVVAPVRS